MHVLELRRLAAKLGILLGLVGAGLSANVEPAEAQGAPPIIRSFAVWAETRPELAEKHLLVSVTLDDPDGEVPGTIQSVIVTAPDGRALDLTDRYRYPGLAFRGDYFLDAGEVRIGTYTLTVTDAQGNDARASDALAAAPPLLPPVISSPGSEAILGTTTPTVSWEPVGNAGSTRVAVRNADGSTVFGDNLYTGPLLAGDATEFTLPAGVLTPGRRYVLEIQAHDTPPLPAANVNNRAVTRRPFSVAGPNVGVTLNQSVFATSQTARLGIAIRNDGAPLTVDLEIWAGIPGGATLELMNAEVEIPSTEGDVSAVMNDIVTHTFDGQEPAGPYAVGVRVRERVTGATISQAIGSFTFAP